ncbi:MAG TPA: dihydrofolate reductase family protein [Flavisolibacter sp.]|nr:dihydrofolate reductase family protein [Flavisolibacter sp.]
MRNLTLVVHLSLDGFVAGAKGELDAFPDGDENLAFVCNLTREADAVLLGRTTYELLDSYWPTARNNPKATAAEKGYSDWYNHAQKIIVSRTLPDTENDHTIIVRESIAGEISKIKQQPGKDILIFGSPTVTSALMQHDLIDNYWVFMNPVIFGEGIPLFRGSNHKKQLRLLLTRQFSNGEVAFHYVPERA